MSTFKTKCFPVSQGGRAFSEEFQEWVWSKVGVCAGFRPYNCWAATSDKISFGGADMVLRTRARYLNSPIDFRLVAKREVLRNIDRERAETNCPEKQPKSHANEMEALKGMLPKEADQPVPAANKNQGQKKARAFSIAKPNFSAYY